MPANNPFGYDGKRAVVVGGATGMGAAVAEVVRDAGAEVVVLDRAEISIEGAKTGYIDLSDKASIEAAAAELGGPIDALFSCAGVADGTPGLERINFLGHRHLITQLVEGGQLQRGSSIGLISSAAGLGWEANFDQVKEYLDITDFDAAAAWAQENGKTDYMFSKQAVCAYVAREALQLMKRGIRINATCPGPTDTPLARANEALWLGLNADYRTEAGVEASSPLEQAYPLAFLCSQAAAAVTGITLVTDAGWFSAGMTGSFPASSPIVKYLLGR